MLKQTLPGGRFFRGPCASVCTVTGDSVELVACTCTVGDDITANAKPASMATPKKRHIRVPEPPGNVSRRSGVRPVAPRAAPKSSQAIKAATEARGPRLYIITVACMGSGG